MSPLVQGKSKKLKGFKEFKELERQNLKCCSRFLETSSQIND
jgi:hypothetical protein